MSRVNEKIYFECKEKFSEFVNSTQDNLAWTPSADFALTQMLHAMIDHIQVKPRVFSSVFEHHSLLVPLLNLNEQDKIDLSLFNQAEEICLVEILEDTLKTNDILAFGHTTQVLGLYRDINKLAKITGDQNYLISDLSRTAGQNIIDIENIDIAIFDGSIDLLGPAGSGFINVKDDLIGLLNNPFPSSGNVGKVSSHHATQLNGIEKFEIGGPNIGSMAGLQASVDFLTNLGTQRIGHRKQIMTYLLDRLDEIEEVFIIDPFKDHSCDDKYRSSIVSIDLGPHSHDVALFLDETENIAVRSGLLCSHPGVLNIDAEEILQISTHIYTTKEDIDQLCEGLIQVLQIFGS